MLLTPRIFTAWIRMNQHKSEIPVKLASKILARKSPDVPLYADDMVYIPNRTLSKTA